MEDGRILSYFGAARKSHVHQGVDIAGQSGQRVVATAKGRVVYSGQQRGYGRTVVIDHGGGFRTLYAHNSALLVRDGEKVRRGQAIARVGRSGNASTTHCHFEVRQDNVPVDPLLYVEPGVGETR